MVPRLIQNGIKCVSVLVYCEMKYVILQYHNTIIFNAISFGLYGIVIMQYYNIMQLCYNIIQIRVQYKFAAIHNYAFTLQHHRNMRAILICSNFCNIRCHSLPELPESDT